MLLVFDAGNSEIELGLFRLDANQQAEATLVADWRLSTSLTRTADEYGVLLTELFALGGRKPTAVHGIIIASVVPPLESTLRQLCERYFHLSPMFIEPGVKTGMPVHYDAPNELGADRIVNAVAAFEKCQERCIVVDFGTATTFDAVSARSEYLGGVIAPGADIAAEALCQRAARLPRIDLKQPAKLIGNNTVQALQAGLFYGYVGLVDGILERMLRELGESRVIATGALAHWLAAGSRYLSEIDDALTLDGLRIIWNRNLRPRRK